jgi:hypothetical protein
MRHQHSWGARAESVPADDAAAWISGLLPDGLFTESPTITIDRDEIVIVGKIQSPDVADDASDADRTSAEAGRITRFRESTREERIGVARQIEHRYQRKVAWGVQCGGSTKMFTTLAAPTMTRLRQPERQVLDTLVSAGVARSRADALAWCVNLVGQHAQEWLDGLRAAMDSVDELRRRGPDLD